MEVVEPRSEAFLTDYFTPEEQSWVARAATAERPTLVTLLWSAKESALKALGQGLRLDTRSVVVSPMENAADLLGWSPLEVRCANGEIFHGWWRNIEGFVFTVMSDLAPKCPIPLADSESSNVAADIIGARVRTDTKSEAFSKAHP